MEQSQLENYIRLFLEGNLSKNDENKLLEWIKQSPENKKYFYSLQQILGEELKTKSDKIITLRWEQMLRRIEPERSAEFWWFNAVKKHYRLAAPVAAALLIGFIISSLVFFDNSKSAKMAVTQQKIIAPYGARTQFMLPDSSLVWLNSGSELVFPSQFNDKRPVKLKGEAYFEVKKANIPFVVSTSYGDVEVKGTSFNVRAYFNDIFETTLISGNVHVIAESKEEVAILPGYQAVYAGKEIRVKPVETKLYTSWTEGKLIFQEEYLPQLAKKLERWYNMKIELDNDPRLNKIIYTGTIEMETFSEVLNLLCITAPVGYTWNDKTRIIKLYYKNK